MGHLRYHFLCLAILATMTIPRAGTKVGEVPVTLPVLLYLMLLGLYCLRPLSSVRIKLSSGDVYEDLVAWSVVTFVALGLVSVAVGMMRGAAGTQMLVEAVALFGFVPAFLLVRSHIREPQALRTVIWLISVSLVITCLYGVCQRIFGHYRVMIPGITIAYSDAQSPDTFLLKNNMTAVGLKVVSTFQNGNLFGNYLALLLPIPAVLLHRARGSRKGLDALFLGLVLVCLLLTLSRSAIVAGVVSLVLLGVLLRKSLTLRIVSLLLVGIGGAFVYLLQLGERLLTFDPTLAGRTTVYDQMAAVYNSLHSLELLSVVFVGAGMGGDIGRGLSAIGETEGSFLIMGMKMGVIGLIPLLVVIVGVFMCAWRRCRPLDSFEAQMGCALAAGVIGCSVQLAIDSVMLMPPTSMNYWLVIGLALVACSIARQQTGDMA